MNVVFWGTRGSLASPGPGDGEVRRQHRVRRGARRRRSRARPRRGLRDPAARRGARPDDATASTCCSRTCTWTTSSGSASSTRSTAPTSRCTSGGRRRRRSTSSARLARYLSPPLFPVRMPRPRVPAHAARRAARDVRGPELRRPQRARCRTRVRRSDTGSSTTHGVVTYLTDHEPALGVANFPGSRGVDVGVRPRPRRRRVDPRRAVRRRRVPRPRKAGATARSRTRWRSPSSPRSATSSRSTTIPRTTTRRSTVCSPARAADLPFDFTVASEGLEIELPRIGARADEVDPEGRCSWRAGFLNACARTISRSCRPGVAFYAFLAFVPTLIAVVSVYGLVAEPADVATPGRQLRECACPTKSRTSSRSS